MRKILTTALCATLLAPGVAGAQTSEADQALAKLQRVMADATAESLCEAHGYKDNPAGTNEAIKRALMTAMGAGVDDKTVDRVVETTPPAEVEKATAEIDAIFADEDPEAIKTAARRWASGVGERCARMAAEPAAAAIISAPPGYDRAAGLDAAVDEFLESGGLASWQTPQIFASGQYLYDLGTCRRRLGARKADRLAAPLVGKTRAHDRSAPREQRYYADSYAGGIEDIKDAAATAKDCAALTVPAPANPAAIPAASS